MHRVRLGFLSICVTLAPALGLAQQAPEGAAAIAGDTTISSATLEHRSANRRRAEDDAYAMAQRRLDAQHRRTLDAIARETLEQAIDEALLARAASDAGRSTEEILAGVSAAAPTEADVAAFYAARQAQIGAPLAVVADAIRQHLAEEARARAQREFQAELRKKYGARVLVEPLREAVTDDGPSRGPKAAAVTIVEFADFQCPFCVRAEPELARILEHYSADVRLVFRHLPLPDLHPEAQRAAEAAACADEQHRFWAFHDGLFMTAGQFDAATMLDTATKAGADRKTLTDCLHSGRAVDIVRNDVAAADSLGIAGTPALFINGRLLSGPATFETIAAVIDDELLRQRDGQHATRAGSGR